MRSVVAVLVCLFLAQAAAAVEVVSPRSRAGPDSAHALVQGAIARERADGQARLACVAGAEDLRRRILAGSADGFREANAAASQGCFAMMTGYSSIPSGTAYAPGVQCRPNGVLFVHGRMRLLSFAGSDVVPLRREQAEAAAASLARLGAFALTYNRTIVAHPEFPYRDLCRLAGDRYRPSHQEDLPPSGWGFRDIPETDSPVDLHEAARRGTAESLRRLIQADPIGIHLPDVLDMTPLAWAVAYENPIKIALLLEAGAHPYGSPYRTRPTRTSPMSIARVERNRRLAAMMRPALEARGLPIPDIPALLDLERSRSVAVGPAGYALEVSPQGRVTDCHLVAGGRRFNDPVTCERLRQSLFFVPAENGHGEPIASTVYYNALTWAAVSRSE